MMDTTWRTDALEVIEGLIEEGDLFTADDVIERVGLPDEDHQANSRNSGLGAIFGELSKAGRIKAVGVVASQQPHRKRGMIRVWQAA